MQFNPHGGDPVTILYQVFEISYNKIQKQLSPYKRTESNLLADSKGFNHLCQVVVWIIRLYKNTYAYIIEKLHIDNGYYISKFKSCDSLKYFFRLLRN